MPGRYIVVFKESVDQKGVENYAKQVDEQGGKVTAKYGSTLNGFAAELPDNLLSNFSPGGSFAQDIDYIEPDGPVSTQSLV